MIVIEKTIVAHKPCLLEYGSGCGGFYSQHITDDEGGCEECGQFVEEGDPFEVQDIYRIQCNGKDCKLQYVFDGPPEDVGTWWGDETQIQDWADNWESYEYGEGWYADSEGHHYCDDCRPREDEDE